MNLGSMSHLPVLATLASQYAWYMSSGSLRLMTSDSVVASRTKATSVLESPAAKTKAR